MKMSITGEWQFTKLDLDGNVIEQSEWLSNHITEAGLTECATLLASASSPWIVLGSDKVHGDVITEGYRKQVSAVTHDGAVVRFRTMLTSEDAGKNDNWEKAALFIRASGAPGTGTMINVITEPFGKTENTQLIIETRITFANGVD